MSSLTFARVAHLESIRILLLLVASKQFKIFQMDVKSAFLNGFIEEVYVKQPPGFENLKFPTVFSSFKKPCTVLSKLLELGKIVSTSFLLVRVLKWGLLIKLFSC